MHVRLAEQHTGIVGEVARREVVRAVHDDVVVAEDLEGVVRREPHAVLDDPHVRVHPSDPLRHHLRLRPADVRRSEQDLAVQVRGIHHVIVDEAEGADPGRGQILGQRTAEPSRADQEHPCREQRLLTFEAHLGKVKWR